MPISTSGWDISEDVMQAIPTDVPSNIAAGLDIVETTVGSVTDMIMGSWILWLSLTFGILGFAISIFRRLRKRK